MKTIITIALLMHSVISFADDEYYYVTNDWCEANFKNKRLNSPCEFLSLSIKFANEKNGEYTMKVLDDFAEKSIEIINQSAYLQFNLTKDASGKIRELQMAYFWWLEKVAAGCRAAQDSLIKSGEPNLAYDLYKKEQYYLSLSKKIEFY